MEKKQPKDWVMGNVVIDKKGHPYIVVNGLSEVDGAQCIGLMSPNTAETHGYYTKDFKFHSENIEQYSFKKFQST